MTQVTRWVDIGDPHGDEIDEVSYNALFSFLDDFKPNIVVHGGDNWNFPQLRKKASDKEKDLSMDDDWQMGLDFLDRLMSYGETKRFLRGNHDERLWDLYREGNGQARLLAKDMIRQVAKIIEKRGAKMRPYDSRKGVLSLPGMPRVIHGYACGENAAKHFASVYGTCLYSHTHSMDTGVVRRYPKPDVAYGTGCLCVIDQHYNSRNTGKLRHENGWTYGFSVGGQSTVMQCRRVGNSFYATNQITQY